MKKFLATLLLLCVVSYSRAQESSDTQTNNTPKTNTEKSVNKISQPSVNHMANQSDFVFKGESMVGLTVSYGTIESDDSNIALLLDNLNLHGQSFSIKPHYGFFYRDNNAVGIRLGYSYLNGSLDNASLNLGEANDIELSVGGIAYTNRGFSTALYHRSYMGLDKKGRFGLFAEWELSGSMTRTIIDYDTSSATASSLSDNYRMQLSFIPGLAVYILPNVCASVSFGLGGLQYNHIRQFDSNMNVLGKRNYSKLRFGLDLTQINIGVNVHLWNKKKEK